MPSMRVRTGFTGGMVGAGLNTAYFFTATANATSAQAAVDRMRDFWTAMNSSMNVNLSWNVQGIVQVFDAATGDTTSEISVTPRTGAGTVSGDPLPFANQGLLRLTSVTFVGGRRVQGHWNIPGPSEGANTAGGVPLASYITVLQNAGTAAATGADPALAVWSRKHGILAIVASTVAVGKWAVLRSRRD